MSYDLHITRAEQWIYSLESPISEPEWMSVVNTDDSLELSPQDHCELIAVEGGIKRIHPVYWTRKPEPVNFWYDDGAIIARSPDTATIRKMIEIAQRLEAYVIGDDGEIYTEETLFPFWKRWARGLRFLNEARK